MTEDERMAAIGRAVVEHLHPGNERAAREATPALVVGRLERDDALRHSLGTCDALKIGRLVLMLHDALPRRSP